MRKRLIISLLLIIALLSFYAALPRLAEQAVIATLHPYGVQVDRFDLEHPGWNKVLIRKLKLHHSTPDYALQLDSRNVQAHFSLIQLFRQNEVEQFTIGSADIRLTLHPQQSEDSTVILPPPPSEVLSQLPVNSVRIEQFKIDTDLSALQRPDLPNSLSLLGDLQLTKERLSATIEPLYAGERTTTAIQLSADNHNRLTLELTHEKKTALSSQMQINLDQSSLQLNSNSELTPEALIRLAESPLLRPILAEFTAGESIPAITGKIQIEGQTSLLQDQTEQLTGNHKYQIEADLDLAQPHQLLPDLPAKASKAALQLKTEITVDNLLQLALKLNQLKLDLAEIEYSDPQLQLSSPQQTLILTQPATINAVLKNTDQLEVPDLNLELRGAAIPFKFDNQPGSLTYQPIDIEISNIDLVQQSADINLPGVSLSPRYEALSLPQVQLSSRIKVDPDTITQRFNASLQDNRYPEGRIDIRGNTKTDLPRQISSGYWRVNPIDMARIDKLIRSYLPDLPPELVINSGTFKHQGWFDFRTAGLALRLLNEAEDVNLDFDQTRLFDSHWQSETLQRHSGRLTDSGSLRVGFIDLGLPLENFESNYTFRRSARGQQRLDIDSSTLNLLGGEMTTLPVSFDPAKPDFETAVALTHLDLAEVIALEQQRGLSGAGTLNGQMPVRFVDNQVTVSNGQILSTPEGGWIRFDPPPEFRAMAQANPALSIAFDALENLQYDSLGIELDYLSDGTALLKTHLKGQNPDWNNGQPVDFTINIEENLPKLIQALQFTDKLTETIEKRYR